MRTASPWWFSLLFAGSLLLIFLGERAFGYLEAARALFTGAGALLALGITGLRVWIVAVTSGDRRRVERSLLACQIGALVALGMYWLTTQTGRGLIGLGALEGDALERFDVPMTVLWSIVMVVSLVPMLMIETSLGTARRSSFSFGEVRASERAAEALEAFRVREMAASGLTIALALSLLMVTCNIAEQRNVRRDLSYFKTSSPGLSTIQISRNVSEPIRVLLFFPQVHPVTNEVRGYLQALAGAGGRILVEERDTLVDKKLAQEYRVSRPGAIVLRYLDKFEIVQLTVDEKKIQKEARTELRELDGKINAALLQVVRARRKAYMIVGHGEINDPMTDWGKNPGAQAVQIGNILRALNYEVEPLGLMNGLASQVPDDADLVLLLAPTTPLSDEEMVSLDTYLAGNGKMLIVLDPDTEVGLGRLEQRLGVRVDRAPITDDKNFLPISRTVADRRVIMTSLFSAHASTTTLSRLASSGGGASQLERGTVFINAGSIENVDVQGTAPERLFVIRSMSEAFRDLNDDFQFNEGAERRSRYALVAAIESREDEASKQKSRDPALPVDVKQGETMRAMVFADADVFVDEHQAGWQQILGPMVVDAIKWLGG
ncbi:MAG TPA: Gldg family protein, partial [Haliangium sp.]|nr:Gldg family protein [Haliangium sp.]